MYESLLQDLKYAARTMWRNSGFTVVVVVCLALAVGVNTAIFSLIDALILRKLPVRDPQRLVELLHTYPGEPRTNAFSWHQFEYFRDQNTVFSALIASGRVPFHNQSYFYVERNGAEPDRVNGSFVALMAWSSIRPQSRL